MFESRAYGAFTAHVLLPTSLSRMVRSDWKCFDLGMAIGVPGTSPEALDWIDCVEAISRTFRHQIEPI